jgi:SAM-dependent methyltransferase
MEQEELRQLAAETWYYQIELADGIVTNGSPRPSAAVWREFIHQVDVKDKTCLDIGSQEFVGPVVLLRQGAGRVIAYDVVKTLNERYEAIQRAYNAEFTYVSGLTFNRLRRGLIEAEHPTAFDFVNFCGVLYHMVDPLVGLATARSFVREGGILLIETAVKKSGDYTLEFNAAARLYPFNNYFFVSIATLDYWLRMLRLEALDCAWFGQEDELCRLVVVCRAVDSVVADADDQWMGEPWIWRNFLPYGLDYDSLASDEPEVGYLPREGVERVYRDNGSVDLFLTTMKTPRFKPDERLRMLRLADQY